MSSLNKRNIHQKIITDTRKRAMIFFIFTQPFIYFFTLYHNSKLLSITKNKFFINFVKVVNIIYGGDIMLKNLKLLRHEAGISQEQLANVIGVSQQSVNKYENHSVEPDIETIIKIADFFCVTTDYLIGRTEIKKAPSDFPESLLNADEKELIKTYRKSGSKEKEIIGNILKLLSQSKSKK